MLSDEALALRVQKGNQTAMETLVERYYDPLLNYMLRLSGGKPALAEDLVQDAFLKMMRGIVSFDPSRSFKVWLYAIATNNLRNYFKRADTRYTHNTPEDTEYADTSDQPEAHLLHHEAQQAVMQALANLPDHQREVVVLFYYQELPQKEIAEILGIPVGTVKSRLSIGLRRLRDMMKEMEWLS